MPNSCGLAREKIMEFLTRIWEALKRAARWFADAWDTAARYAPYDPYFYVYR
jgi:hypothetical protein